MDRGRVATAATALAVTVGIVAMSGEQSQDLSGMVSFLTVFITTVAMFAIFTLGLNVQWGYTGIFNFGVVGFFMVGAYTSAILTMGPSEGVFVRYVGGFELPFPLGLAGAAVASGIVAFLIAIPALRLREDYLAIATIGVAEVFRRIAIEEEGLVNGTRGLTGIPRPLHDLVSPPDYKYLYLGIVLAILLLVFVAIERVIRSPWGRVLRSIREDELATTASGKNILAFKFQSFVLGAMIMGIGGAVYAHNQGAVSDQTFTHFFGTFIFWAMLIVGGSGNNKGAILGAYVVWGFWEITGLSRAYLPEALDLRIFYIRDLLIGLLIVTVLLLRPQGLMGEERRVSLFIGREAQDERSPPGVSGRAAPEGTPT